MKRATSTVAAILMAAGITAAPTPAHGDTELPPHGYTQTTVCIVRADQPYFGRRVASPIRAWPVAAAVHLWNKAQSHVHLSMVPVPGCDVLEVREFAGPEYPDWFGYVDWPTYWERSATYERESYHHARVWLSHAKLVKSYRPKFRGTMRQCWRKWAVTHEIGHALGLDHATGSESVMSYEHDFQRHCGRPSVDDAGMVAALYTPVTTPDTPS